MKYRIINRYVVPPVALGVLAAALAGCNRSATAPAPPPPSVTVAPVEQKEIVEWDEFTGRTEPVDSVEVRPRVSGYIQEVRFQSGQLVKTGDVLFVIDPSQYQAQFDKSQAEVELAQVQLENAKREADRTAHLLETKAISTEEGDARVSHYQEAKAALSAAQATRDSAKLNLEYTQVLAPIDGRVSRAYLTVGNYVNGVAGAATPLTSIVSVSPVYVYADVDEDSLLKFNTVAAEQKLETNSDGTVPVEMQLADEQDFLHKGYIESFDNHLNPNTGSILLRAVFPNGDGRIVPGLFARIRVPLSDRHAALLVDEKAICTDQAQKYVLTLTSSNTVDYASVELGPFIDGKRVVRSGLRAGEDIIVNGLKPMVRPGMTVKATKAVAEDAAPRVRTAQR